MPRYIDADALKDVIQQHDYPLADRMNSIDNGMFTPGIFQAIDQMPTVSPDEVQGVGKWISKTMSVPNGHGQTYNRWGCSVCKKKVKTRTAFCPSCGAKMEVSE